MMSELQEESSLTTRLSEINPAEAGQKPPRRRSVQWGGSHHYIYELEIVGQLGPVNGRSYNPNTIGWVLSGLRCYIERYGQRIDNIPSTYTRWEDEFGDDDGYYRGAVVRHGDRVFRLDTAADRAASAHRALTDGGRYNQENYAFFECVPVSVLVGPEGAVAIAPEEVDVDESDEVDIIWTSEED